MIFVEKTLEKVGRAVYIIIVAREKGLQGASELKNGVEKMLTKKERSEIRKKARAIAAVAIDGDIREIELCSAKMRWFVWDLLSREIKNGEAKRGF